MRKAPRQKGGRTKAEHKRRTSTGVYEVPAQQKPLLCIQGTSGRLREHLCPQVLGQNSCLAGNQVHMAQLACEGDTGSPPACRNTRAAYGFHGPGQVNPTTRRYRFSFTAQKNSKYQGLRLQPNDGVSCWRFRTRTRRTRTQRFSEAHLIAGVTPQHPSPPFLPHERFSKTPTSAAFPFLLIHP